MSAGGRLRLLIIAVVFLFTATCTDEFPFAPEAGEAVFHVRVEPLEWPSSLKLGESSALRVRLVETGSGREIVSAPGLAVRWSVNGAAIQLDGTTGLETTARGSSTGQATPVVSVSGDAVADTLYGGSVIEVFAAGVGIEQPAGDTVLDARGDTLRLVARGLDVTGAPVDGTGVAWRSAPGDVVNLLETSGDTVRAVASGVGQDTIYAEHNACMADTAGTCRDQVLVVVAPVAVSMTAAADTVLLSALGATDTAAVVFADRNGFPVPGEMARWSLVDPADSAVIALDTLNGAVTAMSAGVADVAVTSDVGADTTTVMVYQVVATAGITPDTALMLEGVGTRDTLRIEATDANGAALQRAVGVTWSSTDSLIARVDPVVGDTVTGVVTVIGFGDAWIRADVEGVADSVFVTATGVVASVDVSPTAVTVTQVSARPRVDAAAFDSLGNEIPNAAFTWSSADTAVAKVSPAPDNSSIGIIEPVAEAGTTLITATSGSFSDDTQVTIDLVTVFACDAPGGTGHPSGSITSSETWTRDGSPHRIIDGDLIVEGEGTVVTVQPGALVCSDYGSLRAENGGRILAVGTAADRILFTVSRATANDRWNGLLFSGAPGDTSRLEHVVVEQATQGITAWDDHPVVIQNSLISQTDCHAVVLESPGSRIADSQVEQTNQCDGVRLANHTRFERTTVNGAARYGVTTERYWEDTVAVVGGRIEGSGDVGLNIGGAYLTQAAPVRITGGRSHPVDATWDNVRALYPTLADQDSLLGNQFDEIGVTCSRITADTVTVRRDLPWRVTCWVTVDSVARVVIQPGATIRFHDDATLTFSGGGALEAMGTATAPITFTSLDPNSYAWQRISFNNDASADTSRIRHAVIEYSDQGVYIDPAAAPVVLDSSVIRQSERATLGVFAPGSRVSSVVADTTYQPADLPAVSASGDVLLDDVTVRGAAGTGLQIQGHEVRLRTLRILDSGGVGLVVTDDHRLAEVQGLRITGGDSYPVEAPLEALHTIASTREAQDSLLGNAKDTVVVTGGRLTGDVDVFGNPTAVDTLVVRSDVPWRVSGHAVFDSAAVHLIEPGANLAFEEGAELRYSDGGRLTAVGTEADPILFTAVDPSKPWTGLDIDTDASDTSMVAYATLEYAGGSGHAVSVHSEVGGQTPTVFFEHVTIRQSANRALWVGWTRLRDVVVDTTHGLDGGTAAVELGHGSVVDSMTIRSVEGVGLLAAGNDPVLKHVRIEGTGDVGLDVSATALDSATDIRVTGAGSYPIRTTLDNLFRIAPTAADQANLLGSAKDTILVIGGRLKGELDAFGNPSVVDTLVVPDSVPWRVEGTAAIDAAAVLVMEPGAHIAFTREQGFDIGPGQLLARGTGSDPVVLAAAHPLQQWKGLHFQGDATDTSRVRHTRILYAGGGSPFAAIASDAGHPVLLEHVFIKRPEYRGLELRAPGSRVLDVYVDSASSSGGGHGVVDIWARASVDSLTVVQPQTDGVWVFGDSVVLRDVRVDGAQGIGLQVDPGASLAEASHVVVTNGASYGVRATPEAIHTLTSTGEAQDSLLGNARDTLVFLDGTLKGQVDAIGNVTAVDTLVARPDVPWRLSGDITFDSASLMLAEPGASITVDDGVLVQFYPGLLHAQGTATDTILFRAAHPLQRWAGLLFQGSPADASRLSYVRVEDASTTDRPHPAVSADDGHRIVLDHVMVKRSQGSAVALHAPGSSMVHVTVDTITGDAGQPAVMLGAAVTMDSTVIRGARAGGLEIGADSVRVVGVRILEGGGYGLEVGAWVQPDTLAGIRVTGGQGVPFRGPVQALAMLHQDSLTGNARDSLVINGGILRGTADAFGNVAHVDTLFVKPGLPWRVESDVVFDQASALYLEPGASVAVASGTVEFTGALLLSLGTAANPVRFGPAQAGQIWHGLYLWGNPRDTSYVRNTVIEYAGAAGRKHVALEALDSATLVIDSTVIRQSEDRALVLGAPGSRITHSVIDTTHNTAFDRAAVALGPNTAMHGTVVRGAGGIGVVVQGDGVSVDSSEITLSGSEGMRIAAEPDVGDPSTITVNACNFVDNAGIGMENLHSLDMDATGNWWGDAAGPNGAGGDGVGTNITFDPWLAAAVIIPWYRPGGP